MVILLRLYPKGHQPYRMPFFSHVFPSSLWFVLCDGPGYSKTFQKNGDILPLHMCKEYLLGASYELRLGAQQSRMQNPGATLPGLAA